jgi:hypothetical protein
MKKTLIEIFGGAAAASVVFLCCVLIIGQLCVLCMVKKFAYATLIGMPIGSIIGINLVDRFLYASKEFTVVGTLMGLAFTMILLLMGIYLVAAAPATFFAFPVFISACCVLGQSIGSKINLRKQAAVQRAGN